MARWTTFQVLFVFWGLFFASRTQGGGVARSDDQSTKDTWFDPWPGEADPLSLDVGRNVDLLSEDVEGGLDGIPRVIATSDIAREPRQLSLLYQGVYLPDSRFNPFVDGVMLNMLAEMKRKRMDPLYFRVYDQGVVEHVPTKGKRAAGRSVTSLKNKFKDLRQSPSAVGGGVVRGLTKIKRFGNAEVQSAGNTTLIRAHWLTGPLDVIIDYRGHPAITRVRTGLQAIQFDTLTAIDRFGAEMLEFQLISPLFDYMPYYGNRTLAQQQTTELVIRHLFSNASFMAMLLRDAFEIASYDKIIPQFGADDNYYSVLQHIFSGQTDALNRLKQR